VRFLVRLLRSPGNWFLFQIVLLLIGGFLLSRVLRDRPTWVAIGAWFAYLIVFGIVGMRLGHRIGVLPPPSELRRRGAPDV
jgi:hypothetical protein